MDAATRDLIRRRAEDRCEYCLLSQGHSELTHHIEHTVATQHLGPDSVDNLALACHRCVPIVRFGCLTWARRFWIDRNR
jgi:hypothetical protein